MMSKNDIIEHALTGQVVYTVCNLLADLILNKDFSAHKKAWDVILHTSEFQDSIQAHLYIFCRTNQQKHSL